MERPHLIDLLSEALRRRLTLLSTPAGYGETTLLSQWITRSPCPVAWLTLDATDNDPARFWAYLIAAIETQHPYLGNEALALLRAPNAPPGSFLTALTNAISALPDDLILVLDDYYLIEDEAIHEGITFLIEHALPHLRLVIATRNLPSLPIARLRARSELLELNTADLSFTSDETTAFLNETLRLNLPDEELAALAQRTEGWVAALQLAPLSLRECHDVRVLLDAFTASPRYVADYLFEEVLAGSPKT